MIINSRLFFIMLLFASTSINVAGQRTVKLDLVNDTEVQKGRLTLVKIFNCSSTPLAIKSSSNFNRFSEEDTVDLAPLGKAMSNEYNLALSFKESKEEGAKFYRLVIINPQTYLIVNAKLVNWDTTKEGIFYLEYTSDFAEEEGKQFTTKSASEIIMLNSKRSFLTKKINADSLSSTIIICDSLLK